MVYGYVSMSAGIWIILFSVPRMEALISRGRSSLSLVAFGHSDKSSDQISRLCLFCAAQRSRACARHKGL